MTFRRPDPRSAQQPQPSDGVKDVAGSPRPNVQPGSRFASTTDTAGPFDARSSLFDAIHREAVASLEVLDDLAEQGVLPEIEVGDFRASLNLIKHYAERGGAE